MTILAPNKQSFRSSALLVFLSVIILAQIVLAISLYNRLVELRQAVKSRELEIISLESKNAELRNTLYSTLESKHLLTAAKELGFIMEGKPVYLETRLEKLAQEL